MKFLSASFILFIFIVSCRPSKKLQATPAPVATSSAKTDTAILADTSNQTVDSASAKKNIYNKVVSSRIRFTTFNAKVKLGYSGSQGNGDATAFIRMRKDSILWISLRGPLGIEGFRILITRDSVIMMDLLKKNVQYKTIAFLQQVTGIPFDFSTLQDLVIGTPVFIDSNIVSMQKTGSELSVLMQGNFFKNLLALNILDYSVQHSHLEKEGAGNPDCNLIYTNYKSGTEGNFSTERNILINEKQPSKMDVTLEFKQYEFNQQVTFPFNIPGNYKRM